MFLMKTVRKQIAMSTALPCLMLFLFLFFSDLLFPTDNATLASLTSTTTTSTTTTTERPPPPPSKNLTEARPSSYRNSTSQSWRLERLEEELEVARAQIKSTEHEIMQKIGEQDRAIGFPSPLLVHQG